MERLKITSWQGKSIDAPGRIPAEFIVREESLSVKCTDSVYSIGVLTGKCEIVNKEALYCFSTHVNTESERCKAYAVAIQYDGEGRQIAGDYFTPAEDGLYSLSMELLKNCEYIEIELTFYSFGEGMAEFSNPVITAEEKRKHRTVNVATAYFERKWYKEAEKNIDTVIDIMEKAAADENKPDIICFTETTYDRGVIMPFVERYIPDSHPQLQRVRDKAKELGMNVVLGYHEDDNGVKYNTAEVISAQGETVKKVHKTHLCYDELTGGIVPGDELPVIELPFGKIAVIICWDQWFPEATRKLVEKGAEMIFVSTAGYPECISRARAYENGVFLISAGCEDGQPQSSFIANEHGDIIASVSDIEKGYAVATVDLDAHKYIRYLSFANGYGRNLYKTDRRDDLY